MGMQSRFGRLRGPPRVLGVTLLSAILTLPIPTASAELRLVAVRGETAPGTSEPDF